MKARIQVVACKCCTELPQLLDMERLLTTVSEKELVVSSVLVDRVCDSKNIRQMVAEAREREVDRVLVMACQKKDVNPGLLASYKRAGINESLVEYVDLRDEVVLPHLDDKKRAQAKAEAKALAGVARLFMLEPLEKARENMRTANVVVLGGGASGRRAAEVAASQGAHTIIIEKSGRSFKAPGVLMPNSTLLGAKGHGGNFVLTIRAGEKVEELECAAVVVATGGGWAELKGPLAKACKSALTLHALDEQFRGGAELKGPVVIVDTPDPSGKSLAVQDFAWDETLALAADIKRKHPQEHVSVIFQEMRAFGLSEIAYKEAAELGVNFIRYDRSAGPKVDPKEPAKLVVKDLALGEALTIPFGTLAFAAIPANKDNMAIADALRIPMSPEGGVRRGSIQRWPVSTPRPGVFVCGSAMFPKGKDAAQAEGEAAGLLAGRFAMKGTVEYGGVVAEVDQEKCSACLTCVRTCPYDAPFIGTAGKAEIRVQACQGCGMCAGVCPSKAIELKGFTDDQIAQETRAMLGGDF